VRTVDVLTERAVGRFADTFELRDFKFDRAPASLTVAFDNHLLCLTAFPHGVKMQVASLSLDFTGIDR
jgi:hypothetical protein